MLNKMFFAQNVMGLELNTLTINLIGNGEGSININDVIYTGETIVLSFPENEEIDITAIDDAFSMFFGWSGDISPSTAKTETILMDSDKTINCQFDLPFILKIDTRKPDYSGFDGWVEPDNENDADIDLFLGGNYSFDFLIDWGDGVVEYYTQSQINTLPQDWNGNRQLNREYDTPGEYRVKITGIFGGIAMNFNDGVGKLIDIEQWGEIMWDDALYAFAGCDNLVISATDIPRFDDVISCEGLFFQCLKIENIQSNLFSNGLLIEDFSSTFGSCRNLEAIPPNLFDNNSEVTTFSACFSGCRTIVSIPPNLFDNNVKTTDISALFQSCWELTIIPDGLFDNLTGATNIIQLFPSCNSLKSIPDGLFDNLTEITSMFSLFQNCRELNTIQPDMFKNNKKLTNAQGTFNSCYSLTTIPPTLFSGLTQITTFDSTFGACTGITSIPDTLFDSNTGVTSMAGTFNGCISLTSLPAGLFKNNALVINFGSCFRGCSSVQTIAQDIINPLDNPNAIGFSWVFRELVSVQGNSPDVWKNWNGGAGPGFEGKPSVTKVACFTDSTGFDDYDDIPAVWGGGGA